MRHNTLQCCDGDMTRNKQINVSMCIHSLAQRGTQSKVTTGHLNLRVCGHEFTNVVWQMKLQYNIENVPFSLFMSVHC